MEIKKLLRPNIASLAPYSTARDEFKGVADIYIDANESPYNNGFNRYPDPHQKHLKKRIAELKHINPICLFLGNGSDEPIDLLYRMFCEPAVHNVVTIAPSYGMYRVAADINNIDLIEVPLDKGFELNAEKLISACDKNTRLVFLCSPNNPSGNLLNYDEVIKVLERFEGITVIDEAYIDFANSAGFATLIQKYPRLVVLQTLSKAWGMAGLRLGMAIASPSIIDAMSKVKYPYNISVLTQNTCLQNLMNSDAVKLQIDEIKKQREILAKNLADISFVKKIYPSDANFILVEVSDADRLYQMLCEKSIIVRNRNRVLLCKNCLRISVGTETENNNLIETLKLFKL